MHGCSEGGCGCSGGDAWLLQGACMVAARGGMHGCSGGHAWLLLGGVACISGGLCVVAPGGGMHGCSWGVCMVAPGGVWLLPGGTHGCSWGVCMVALGGMHGCSREGGHVRLLRGGSAWDTTRYGDTINERAVRILLECILVFFFDGERVHLLKLKYGTALTHFM